MKRILSVLLLACLLVATLTIGVSAQATSGTCGDNATWTISGSTLTISGSGAIEDYIYVGYERPGNEMAPWRYDSTENNPDIKKIVINSGITRIGDNAFCCLPNVTSVSIPNTVTSIGQAAFCDIKKLSKITIPDSVTEMERSVFNRCSGLTSVKLPNKLKKVPGSLFSDCGKLKTVTLPKGITTIEGSAFDSCYALESITIPAGVTTIEAKAFQHCEKLKTIKLPNSVAFIGPFAFWDSGLTSITIPKKVDHIYNDTLGWCMSLKKVYFTGDAPDFDSGAFNCTEATAYYPRENATWTESVRKNYDGTITWVAYCADGHTWGEWATQRDATCAKEGLQIRACSACDVTEEKSIAKTEHQYTATVTKPTCKDKGFTTHTCQACKESYIDSYVDVGTHVFGEWVVLKAATCMETGSRQRICSVCQTQETEEVGISDHTYRDEVTAATCTQQGFTVHTCTVCSDTVTDSYTEPTPHTFGEWEELVDASWTKEGQRRRRCTACPETQTEVIAKIPINWVAVISIGAGLLVVASGAVVMTMVWKEKKR